MKKKKEGKKGHSMGDAIYFAQQGSDATAGEAVRAKLRSSLLPTDFRPFLSSAGLGLPAVSLADLPGSQLPATGPSLIDHIFAPLKGPALPIGPLNQVYFLIFLFTFLKSHLSSSQFPTLFISIIYISFSNSLYLNSLDQNFQFSLSHFPILINWISIIGIFLFIACRIP